MRHYSYSYQDAKGLRHEGEIKATSKDDAYAELRKQGIRPIKVTERIAPIIRRGFKGLRKRDVMCLVLGVLCLVGVALYLFAESTKHSAQSVPLTVNTEELAVNPEAREQLKRAIEERKAVEQKCREDFIERVKKGTLSKEEANELFRAMGMEELK